MQTAKHKTKHDGKKREKKTTTKLIQLIYKEIHTHTQHTYRILLYTIKETKFMVDFKTHNYYSKQQKNNKKIRKKMYINLIEIYYTTTY